MKKIKKDELIIFLLELSSVLYPYFNKNLRIPAIFIQEDENNFVKIRRNLSFYQDSRQNSVDIYEPWQKTVSKVLLKIKDEPIFVNLEGEGNKAANKRNPSKLLRVSEGEPIDNIKFEGMMIMVGNRYPDGITKENSVKLSLPEEFLKKGCTYPKMMQEWVNAIIRNESLVQGVIGELEFHENVDDKFKTILYGTVDALQECGYEITDKFLKELDELCDALKIENENWRQPETIGEEFLKKLVKALNKGEIELISENSSDINSSNKIVAYLDNDFIYISQTGVNKQLIKEFSMDSVKTTDLKSVDCQHFFRQLF